MDSLNLSPIQDDNVERDDNSASPQSDLNSNQLPQSLGGTPYRSQDSAKYQQNHTPSRELAEIQSKLTNSPGLDGLVRKCNTLKVQSQTQSAITSQFYQQHVDHSLDIRQQMLATNHLLPSNFHKVQDQQIQSIFGEFKTPSKEQPQEDQDIENEDKSQGTLQNNIKQGFQPQERLSVPVDARQILSQKIVSPIGQQQENSEGRQQEEEGENFKQSEQQGIQNSNPLFAQSLKNQEFGYDSKFQGVLQSSSPVDQYKYFNNNGSAGSGLNQYQMGYTSLKWEVQQQQQQIKPKRDFKNNFQSYLSLIGLGQNRSNHHGSTIQNTGNQLYYTSKQQPSSGLVTGGLQSLYRVSSTERSSMRNTPQIQIPFNNNVNNINVVSNMNVSSTNKRRGGLDGIIDKINTKKDSLLQKKNFQQGGGGAVNSSSFVNQSTGNQGTALSSSNSNTNNLIKLSRIHPNTHLSSKQAELEGSLEKIRLISMQRNINFSSNVSKENDQQQKMNAFLKTGSNQFQQQQQQQPQASSLPFSQLATSLRPSSTSTGNNFFGTLGATVGGSQRNPSSTANQFLQSDKYQSYSNQKQRGSTLVSQQPQQQQQSVLTQPIKYIERQEVEVQQQPQLQQFDIQVTPVKENTAVQEDNDQLLNYDAFEDYNEKLNTNTQESEIANKNFVSGEVI